MQPTVGDAPDPIRARLDALERRLGEPIDAEVAYIGPRSCGLVLAVLQGLGGLVYGLWRAYTETKARIERVPAAREVDLFQDYFLPGLVLAVAGLVVGFVAGLVLAKLYNAVAGSVGGVRVRVRVGLR